MNVLLFDIDGTLLSTAGAGRLAMQRGLEKRGLKLREVDIPVHGRTDQAIILDLLQAHEMEVSDQSIQTFYADYVAELGLAMQQCEAKLLPGILELLVHLNQLNHVSVGILTGNGRRATEIKLGHFKLLEFFQFGAYGEYTSDRCTVAANAFQAAGGFLRFEPDRHRTWVIGDTVHDVRCARSIGVKALAVGTGHVCLDELRSSQPDCYLDDLSDIAAVVKAIETDD